MRKFQCYDCGHTWELPFGEGGQGTELTCPECGSKNVHRSAKEHGRGWKGRGRAHDHPVDRERGWRRGWKHRHGPRDEG